MAADFATTPLSSHYATTYSMCSGCGKQTVDESFICYFCHAGDYLESHSDIRSQDTPATSGSSRYNYFQDKCIDPQLAGEQQHTTHPPNLPVVYQRQPVHDARRYGTTPPRADPMDELDASSRATIFRLEKFDLTGNAGTDVTDMSPPSNAGLRPTNDPSLKAVGDRFYTQSEQPRGPPTMRSRIPLAADDNHVYRTQAIAPHLHEPVSPKETKGRKETKHSPERAQMLKMSRAIEAGSNPNFHCCKRDWETRPNLKRHQRWCKKAERITEETASKGKGWFCAACRHAFAKKGDLTRHLNSSTHPETPKTFFRCGICQVEIKKSDKKGYNITRHLMVQHKLGKEEAIEEMNRGELLTVPPNSA